MNVSTLKKLMMKNGIKSYFQLAQTVGIPYTSLLDLIHGRSKNSYLIPILAEYFEIPSPLLLEPLEPYQVILEDSRKKEYYYTKQLSRENAFVRLLLQENFD